MISTRLAIPAGALVLGLALGLGAGWKLYRPKPAPVETAAPAIRQADKSLVLQRRPEAKPQPKHELPKGAKLERQIQVTVLPSIPMDARKIPGSGSLPEIPDSSTGDKVSPITVDLSLVRLGDGTQRVIASSDQGTILTGLDIPVGPPAPTVKTLKNAAGLSYGKNSFGGSSSGIVYERDIGPFRLGSEVSQISVPILYGTTLHGSDVHIWALLRF